jgi:hypothetical protein
MLRTDWTLSSMPYQLQGEADQWSRGTIRWHNPPAIAASDVWEDEIAAGQGVLHPMRLIFRPHGYRYTGPAESPCEDSVATKSWGGIMRAVKTKLPPSPGDIYFQLRAKPTGAIMHVEFGRIDENIDGDGVADNEDQEPWNHVIDIDDGLGVNEDTGLDTLLDQDETDRCGNPHSWELNPDPAGDNWWFEGYGKGVGSNNSRPPVSLALWRDLAYRESVLDESHWLHYEWMNGTEGNVEDPAVFGQPDREDLNGDGLDIADAYLSFTISLQADSTNPHFIPGSERNGWCTYLVSVLRDTLCDTVRSHPALEVDWRYFTHVRVWFEQPEYATDSLVDMDSVWIADWRLVAETF